VRWLAIVCRVRMLRNRFFASSIRCNSFGVAGAVRAYLTRRPAFIYIYLVVGRPTSGTYQSMIPNQPDLDPQIVVASSGPSETGELWPSAIAPLRLRCAFQEVDRLANVLQRLLNWLLLLGGRADVCCYSTEAVVKNLGGCS